MNGESLDREVILACVIELMDIIDEDGNGEITRDEFIQNGMRSGFIRNLMEFFDQDDPKEQSKQPSVEEKIKEKPNEKDHQDSEKDSSWFAWKLDIYILRHSKWWFVHLRVQFHILQINKDQCRLKKFILESKH